ncbi:hypothetical protein E2C01_042264 [Portunus trituberculatus]|uniref:Uncharacterized protein n=1 Tax=Portunus trituberculatus TaxID=210409 RepID=A0A5B7FM03_PORTR|nr:hypothetical protein [Portunus trituberculatus]
MLSIPDPPPPPPPLPLPSPSSSPLHPSLLLPTVKFSPLFYPHFIQEEKRM